MKVEYIEKPGGRDIACPNCHAPLEEVMHSFGRPLDVTFYRCPECNKRYKYGWRSRNLVED